MKDFLQVRTREEKVRLQNAEIAAFRSKDVVKSGARVFFADGRVSSAAQVGEISQDILLANCAKNRDVALAGAVRPKTVSKKQWNLSEQKQHKQAALRVAEESSTVFARELPKFS